MPMEIMELRERLGWSQQHLADLMGFRTETISQWERGRDLQDRSSDNMLRAMRDCPSFREYLEGLFSLRNGKHKTSVLSEAL
jgi:DNA-binding transcriptional regulator YiaG